MRILIIICIPTKSNDFLRGLGASYTTTDLIDIFLDYTRLFDDTGFDVQNPNNDFTADSLNLGLNCNF